MNAAIKALRNSHSHVVAEATELRAQAAMLRSRADDTDREAEACEVRAQEYLVALAVLDPEPEAVAA